MCQNQLTKYLRPSDISRKDCGWLSSQITYIRDEIQEAIQTELNYIIKSRCLELGLLISPKEMDFLELVKNRILFFVKPRHRLNSQRNDFDWDFLDAQLNDNQVTLLEELNKYIWLYLDTSHIKPLEAFEEEHELKGSFLDDNKYWNFKDRNDSHDKTPYMGLLRIITAMLHIRSQILFISELSSYPSIFLGISEQSHSQLLYLSSSYQSWLKANASIEAFSISLMSGERKICSPSVTLNCELGHIYHPSRLVIETNNHRNSNHRCLCSFSSNTCRLHQKSTLNDENHPMQAPGLKSSSTYCMQPKSSRQLHYRRSSPESSRNFTLHASMVGSYEECLIHGRMSTTPSKTFIFFAEISVLGMNKYTTKPKYPTHINIPFPAVFYSNESSTNNHHLGLEARPSPYVGLVDLEKSKLDNCSAPSTPLTRAASRHSSKHDYKKNEKKSSNYNTNQSSGYKSCHAIKCSLRSTCSSPTGGYRIPKIGQVQIIIRNLNKTPVKIFLVPYNLSEMNPGTKTFIRQRSYLTKTIKDESIRSNFNKSETKAHKSQILHALAHIQICSLSRNRFYLYKGIRLIFENRMIDCGERLRTEVSLPEPRYSNYKPESQSSQTNFGG